VNDRVRVHLYCAPEFRDRIRKWVVYRGAASVSEALIEVTARAMAAEDYPADEAIRLVVDALFLRVNGERAPGAPPGRGEIWADWDRRAEAFLRGDHQPAPGSS
jgi:hypothetical protein